LTSYIRNELKAIVTEVIKGLKIKELNKRLLGYNLLKITKDSTNNPLFNLIIRLIEERYVSHVFCRPDPGCSGS
jgi:hypothetical protein